MRCGDADGVARRRPIVLDAYFTEKTMRVDYYHTGGAAGDCSRSTRSCRTARGRAAARSWSTTRTSARTSSRSIDRATNRVIYSRGFASIYGEWETTDEPKQGLHRSFHESLRFPWPKQPVQVVVKKRDGQNAFREVWSTVVDPASRFVNAGRSRRRPARSGRSSRTGPRRRRWTCSSSATATPRRTCRSSTRT